jgi:hypothetical protein
MSDLQPLKRARLVTRAFGPGSRHVCSGRCVRRMSSRERSAASTSVSSSFSRSIGMVQGSIRVRL